MFGNWFRAKSVITGRIKSITPLPNGRTSIEFLEPFEGHTLTAGFGIPTTIENQHILKDALTAPIEVTTVGGDPKVLKATVRGRALTLGPA
ncbi:MAG: hypothetical protein EB059_03360 [Alphaproteobacteria bacterium]|nr:hypothetical protein [Alphaproteobacteria bacterium]